MKKDLIDTIMEKEFHALTDVEREELKSYCASEDEYNQMKDVFLGVEQMTWEYPKPKAETKQRLDDLFDSTYPKAAPVWYSSVLAVVIPKEKPIYRQPLAQIAAVALLALLLVPFWNSDSEVVKPNATPQVAQVEQKPDKTQDVPYVKPEPVVETKEDPVIFKEDTDVRSGSTPVLVASATPSTESSSAGAATPGSNHPDGVFIAVSQPANESPEMFDLLTATF